MTLGNPYLKNYIFLEKDFKLVINWVRNLQKGSRQR